MDPKRAKSRYLLTKNANQNTTTIRLRTFCSRLQNEKFAKLIQSFRVTLSYVSWDMRPSELIGKTRQMSRQLFLAIKCPKTTNKLNKNWMTHRDALRAITNHGPQINPAQLQRRYYAHIHKYSIQQQLTFLLRETVQVLYPSDPVSFPDESLVSSSSIGDFQSTVAYKISKITGIEPRVIADQIVKCIAKKDHQFSGILRELRRTGDAFLTAWMDDNWLMNQCFHMDSVNIKNRTWDRENTYRPLFYAIDYGSPNISKELHVGHLRSALVGDCLSRILKYQGHEVDSVSHVGDFGTPVALVVAHAILTHRKWALNPNEPAPMPHELSRLYVDARNAIKNSQKLKDFTTECLLNIQKQLQTDENILRVYDVVKEVSKRDFDDVYNQLGISIPEKAESWYRSRIPSLMCELREKKLLFESEGALICPTKKIPILCQKKDLSWLYGMTDLACIRYRLVEKKYDRILYVVDSCQKLHFELIFETARRAGWLDSEGDRVQHIVLGIVKNVDGQKVSSRDGTDLTLRAFLQEAISKATESMLEARKNLDECASIDPIFQENSKKIAINAIKYYELSQNRTQNYVFSFSQALSFRGNTCFYILYAYARIQSLLKKANQLGSHPHLFDDSTSPFILQNNTALNPKEHQLVLLLLQLPDVIKKVELTLYPSILSAYLFNVAQKFHSFYENHTILNSPHSQTRLLICLSTKSILSRGLQLLNIYSVDHV